MGRAGAGTVTTAAVDIGTNTVRLLVVDDWGTDLVRTGTVTGLGRGVDASGVFDSDAVAATLDVLGDFRETMDRMGVDRIRAVATSATRDAGDGTAFLDAAGEVLGVRPEVISGDEEASLSFLGGTSVLEPEPPSLVIDIGGGSTEFVYGSEFPEYATSIDMGSVRLTERTLPNRPASPGDIAAARTETDRAFATVGLPGPVGTGIGVGGTWTTLVTMTRGWPDGAPVHGEPLSREAVATLIDDLAGLTIEETARLEGINPARAPVILGGAIVAERALDTSGLEDVVVSESDLLDGIVQSIS
jgi:exopolyphosphatase/guanosine-5'-triphosphate,3'-diphosphate pyrophosphatase